MRFEWAEHFGLDVRKLIALGASLGLLTGLGCQVAFETALGTAAPGFSALAGVLVFYLVVSTPRRALDLERVGEARGSVLLSAATTAFLDATESRTRTILLLRSKEASLDRILTNLQRQVLLGKSSDEAIAAASAGVTSTAARTVLTRVSASGTDEVAVEGEETRGLARSTTLAKETRIPVFMTASFFAPVLLLLYAEFSGAYSPESLLGLLAVEVVILDLAFYLCSSGSPQE